MRNRLPARHKLVAPFAALQWRCQNCGESNTTQIEFKKKVKLICATCDIFERRGARAQTRVGLWPFPLDEGSK